MELFIPSAEALGDDLIGLDVEAGPPAREFNLGHQQTLPLFVDGALGHLNDQTELALGFLPGALDVERQQGDAFARMGFDKGTCRFRSGHPGALVLLARIPFGDEVERAPQRRPARFLLSLHEQQVGAIEAAVLAQECFGLLGAQAFNARKDTLKEIVRLAGRMLLAGTQLQTDVPAFVAKVGGSRRVAIDALVGAADVFLPGITVIHDQGVDVAANVALVRSDGGCGTLQQAQGEFVGEFA